MDSLYSMWHPLILRCWGKGLKYFHNQCWDSALRWVGNGDNTIHCEEHLRTGCWVITIRTLSLFYNIWNHFKLFSPGFSFRISRILFTSPTPPSKNKTKQQTVFFFFFRIRDSVDTATALMNKRSPTGMAAVEICQRHSYYLSGFQWHFHDLVIFYNQPCRWHHIILPSFLMSQSPFCTRGGIYQEEDLTTWWGL